MKETIYISTPKNFIDSAENPGRARQALVMDALRIAWLKRDIAANLHLVMNKDHEIEFWSSGKNLNIDHEDLGTFKTLNGMEYRDMLAIPEEHLREPKSA